MSFGAEYSIFSLLSKNIKIKTYRIIILFVVVVVVYGGENQSITLRDKHRQRGKTFVTPNNAVCLLSCT
jgi:Na+/H+ antiporter NhaC